MKSFILVDTTSHDIPERGYFLWQIYCNRWNKVISNLV